jgi:hypothetical protein
MSVFFYGPLRAGEINDISAVASKHDISAPVLVGTATLAGRLYDFRCLSNIRRCPSVYACPDIQGRHAANVINSPILA